MLKRIVGVLAVLAGTMTVHSGTATAAPTVDCPILEQLGDRVEGAVSPGACTFITKQTEFGAMVSDTPETREARVRLYGSIFAVDGTLAESGTAPPAQGRAGAENNLRTMLTLIQGFQFTPTKVVVHGNVVFYEASNEATVKGQHLRWPALYRVVLTGSADQPGHEVIQGRRYHDRTAWFRPVEGDNLRELFKGVADNCRAGAMAFTGPGLTEPVTDPACYAAYFNRLAGAVTDVRMTADRRASGAHTQFQEYYGTVGARGRTINYGMIVGTGPDSGGDQLVRLYFDTLPLSYDDSEMAVLFGKLVS